ncbi:MAG: CmcJ/NvfI family oxidoreductase [Sphingomonas fennica]
MLESDSVDAGIAAEINYVAPGSFVNRRFVAPAREVNTGTYEPHHVIVRDARPHRAEFTLDVQGFTLLDHRSAVADFLDREAVEATYPGEVVAAIVAATGADRVAPMGWMARTSGDVAARQRKQEGPYQHRGGVQPPAGEAHVDCAPDRADRMAAAVHAQHFPDAAPYSRYLYTSFWRTFSPPPQDVPLALCDGRSVRDDEGTPNTMFVVDAIPSEEEMLRPIPDEDKAIAAAIFHHDPAHRWWYFSNMTRDEALLFKFHDSRRTGAWRVPHTAFPHRPCGQPSARKHRVPLNRFFQLRDRRWPRRAKR